MGIDKARSYVRYNMQLASLRLRICSHPAIEMNFKKNRDSDETVKDATVGKRQRDGAQAEGRLSFAAVFMFDESYGSRPESKTARR